MLFKLRPNIIRVIKSRRQMGWKCSTYGGRICACRVWVGKPEERRAVGKPRPRWEDIKMDLREVGGGQGLDQSGSG